MIGSFLQNQSIWRFNIEIFVLAHMMELGLRLNAKKRHSHILRIFGRAEVDLYTCIPRHHTLTVVVFSITPSPSGVGRYDTDESVCLSNDHSASGCSGENPPVRGPAPVGSLVLASPVMVLGSRIFCLRRGVQLITPTRSYGNYGSGP